MGTAPYMSPEQAQGHKLDARSDIFSFGSLLYEMLTGAQPFAGDSHLSIATKLLGHNPKPVNELVPSLPPDLSKIISRCLRKDPARRYQHMDDLKVALEDVQEASGSATLGPVARTRSRWRWASSLFVAALLATGVFAWWRRPTTSLNRPTLCRLRRCQAQKPSPRSRPMATMWRSRGQASNKITTTSMCNASIPGRHCSSQKPGK